MNTPDQSRQLAPEGPSCCSSDALDPAWLCPSFDQKMKSTILTIFFLSMSTSIWADPQMEMHRLQATTKDPSGWYIAASTKGSFSILIPIPFNDFTVTDDDPKAGRTITHTVGAKSAEGIKFSATETPIIEGRSPTDLAAFPQQFRKRGQTISDIDPASFAGHPSVSFSVKGPSTGACVRCVKAPKSLILVILEYPIAQAKTAEGFRSVFLSSLKINKTEDSPANRRQPTRSETNSTSSAAGSRGSP